MSPKNRNESRISKPGRPKGRFLGGPGGRGEDSSPFRLTSSLILHALHPGGVRRIQNEVKIELWALRDLIFGILGGFARGLIFDELLSRGDTAAPLRTLATSELVFGADTGCYRQMLADAGPIYRSSHICRSSQISRYIDQVLYIEQVL